MIHCTNRVIGLIERIDQIIKRQLLCIKAQLNKIPLDYSIHAIIHEKKNMQTEIYDLSTIVSTFW